MDKYLPTSKGDPPLAEREKKTGMFLKETEWKPTSCPGWAWGSSWYFFRYMDPNNDGEFCSKRKIRLLGSSRFIYWRFKIGWAFVVF